MATIVTVTANTLLDHVATGAVTPGAVVRVAGFEPIAGGKGLNVGRVLARHGHRVIACGFAGGESGATLTRLAAGDGLDPQFTATAARTRIGFQTMAADGGSTAVLEDGFAVSSGELGDLLLRLRAVVPGADLVIASGSVPHPVCHGLYRMLLELCARAGVTCWLDAYGPALDEALAGPHPPALVKPNRQEYGRSGRRWVVSPELHLTDGGAAVTVRHPDGRFRVTPPKVKERNAIGSGDCYLAALAHARLSGRPLADQLRYAAAAGAANAARGALARIAPAEIAALAEDVVVEEA